MIILKLSDTAAEIIGIAVSVDARHKGIGKELIQSVIKSEEIEKILFPDSSDCKEGPWFITMITN
ncbi:GNAT family N-acetyltransferase [Eubacterium ruminantium]|uniref:GNAT family N-acetyltransferase n=1 Tax=Eubacterium ruminantium TaxID=42322 RepID=UPI000999EC9C|nr:GNAT family N-acetyltransferase [Eubacterium ruminantium]